MLQWWQSRGCTAQVAAEDCMVLQWWQPRGCTAQMAAEGCAVLQWWPLRGYAAMVAVEGLRHVAMVAAVGLRCTGGS